MKRGLLIILFAILIIAWAFWTTRPREDWSTGSLLVFAQEFFPPSLELAFLRETGAAAIETLAISISGTALAFFLSFLIAWISTATRAFTWLSKIVFVVLRAVPELLWALIFVFVAGLGPAAGALALAMHTTGVLGKLFDDTFENVDPRIVESVEAAGGSPAAVSVFAVFPQAWTQCIAFTLYRWEMNIRSASVLGLVGAGGLGQLVYTTTNLFQFQRVFTLIVVIFIVVAGVDYMSRTLQRIYS